MKPLVVLLAVFGLTLGITFFTRDAAQPEFSGRVAMAAMLLFTAIGHFRFVEGMALMVPPFVPAKRALVYGSGLFEILLAAGLLFDNLYHITGILLIVFFALILPSNVYAALKRIDYEKATFDGPGPAYLWFRVPLQLFFIGFTWWSCRPLRFLPELFMLF